ncbi:MAG: methyltransferase, partial [Thermodesulfobacteriota bacterium]
EVRLKKSIARLWKSDRVGSAAGAVFFAFWIGQRYYFSYRPTFLWWLVTFQFTLFVLAYLTRYPAREHARGFWETVYPFLCAALPFALDHYPFKPQGPAVAPAAVYLGLMLTGTLLIIAGVFFLRRSFAIMTEVRPPVYGGVYRLTRHPMYLGSVVASTGLVLFNFSRLNLGILVVFGLMQYVRARREEAKIAAHFPEYAAYAARVGWVWRWGRRK